MAMTALVIVTEDGAFAAAVRGLACEDLAVTCVHVEEAVTAARHDHPDILAVDADSVRDSQSLIGALSLLTRARIVALAHQAWPTTRAAVEAFMAGADAVLPKPSGRASPTLAGLDRETYRRWFITIADRSSDGVAPESVP
jgi:ActR/RegA family two-component response regulator